MKRSTAHLIKHMAKKQNHMFTLQNIHRMIGAVDQLQNPSFHQIDLLRAVIRIIELRVRSSIHLHSHVLQKNVRTSLDDRAHLHKSRILDPRTGRCLSSPRSFQTLSRHQGHRRLEAAHLPKRRLSCLRPVQRESVKDSGIATVPPRCIRGVVPSY